MKAELLFLVPKLCLGNFVQKLRSFIQGRSASCFAEQRFSPEKMEFGNEEMVGKQKDVCPPYLLLFLKSTGARCAVACSYIVRCPKLPQKLSCEQEKEIRFLKKIGFLSGEKQNKKKKSDF